MARLVLVVLFCLIGGISAGGNETCDAIVDAFNTEFEDLFNSGNISSLSNLYEDNVSFFIDNKKIEGRSSVSKFHQQERSSGQQRLVIFPRSSTTDELSNIFTTGQFQVYNKEKNIETGFYTQVLRQGSDGVYRVQVEFNDFKDRKH